jgi:hypothetical protein
LRHFRVAREKSEFGGKGSHLLRVWVCVLYVVFVVDVLSIQVGRYPQNRPENQAIIVNKTKKGHLAIIKTNER